MTRSLILGTVSLLGLSTAVSAEVPSVAADIPPVHSLVSIVMGDLGTPSLLVQPGASPHGYSLRPSEANALDQADAVFWIGEALEPWLEHSIASLASDAQVVELLEAEGTITLGFREGATFEAHSHNHGDHDEDHDHDHDEHGDHDHVSHDHADKDHEGHHHHGSDPHAWLDPENAKTWLGVIAQELSELDPENAATYAANAEAGQAEMDSLIAEISATLDPVQDARFIVFHDAYHYFESRFDMPASGSITVSDASAPSPARIEEIQKKVRQLGIRCAFSEPQFDPNLVDTVFQGTDAQAGVMDPLGADLTPGVDLYPQLLRNLGNSLVECLD